MLENIWVWIMAAIATFRYKRLVAHARRMGYVVITDEAFASAAITLGTLGEYVEKSGHLNTVKGRKPRAVHRLMRGLARTANSLAVGITQRGAKAA